MGLMTRKRKQWVRNRALRPATVFQKCGKETEPECCRVGAIRFIFLSHGTRGQRLLDVVRREFAAARHCLVGSPWALCRVLSHRCHGACSGRPFDRFPAVRLPWLWHKYSMVRQHSGAFVDRSRGPMPNVSAPHPEPLSTPRTRLRCGFRRDRGMVPAAADPVPVDGSHRSWRHPRGLSCASSCQLETGDRFGVDLPRGGGAHRGCSRFGRGGMNER